MTAGLPDDVELARCPHCEAIVEGVEDRFCCHGCETAHALLGELGLGDWYERREAPGVRPRGTDHDWESVAVDPVKGGLQTTLAVDGLRCTSCTWVVERVLERTEGVEQVHVSYASGRVKVTWNTETSLRELAERIAALGYSPRPVSEAAAPDPLFRNLGVALFCTANLMLLTAGLYASWLDGMEARFQVLLRWGALALATPVAFYAAAPFWRGALFGIVERRIGMDVPIALAVGVLYTHGVVQTLQNGDAYLDSLGMLVTLLLVGRILEARGRHSAADAAAAIATRLPQTARRRTMLGVEDVSPSELQPGDLLELGPGTEIAADALVTEGAMSVQTAMLTGETAPRMLGVGDTVFAGTVVLAGTGAAQVTQAGENTLAMRMAASLSEAIDRPTAKNPANALAPAFTAITVGIAVIAGITWGYIADPTTGVEVAVAVLVVACPCALGLSVPLGVSAGLGALARRGVLLQDGDALLRLAEIDAVAIDKTGTLTLGEPTILEANDEVLRIAAGLERTSSHPIARAILGEAVRRGVALPFADDLKEIAGSGVAGTIDGHPYELRSAGAGVVALYQQDRLIGQIHLGDRTRPQTQQALDDLRALRLPITVLSGDVEEATSAVAKDLGIDWRGGLLPDQKSAWIREHGRVLFVGDGLNDGPALATAHVGLAMHTGAGVSLGVADGVLSDDGLLPVAAAVRGARITVNVIRANLLRSLLYNVVAVGAAAAGLINPLIAAILMPISSGMVLLGARRIEHLMTQKEST